ncbi:MAG: hypothetical protein E5W39_07645 [Mesorhizobium sp.]|nr:MAG: hypothetical protein E5W39_07645 [Mesorhizobium sp.]
MQQAIALDPAYAEAHRWLAENLWAAWTHWGEPMEPSRSMAVAEAETAVALDPNDAGCRWVYGHMLSSLTLVTPMPGRCWRTFRS